MYRKPYAFYIDSGTHFDWDELRDFLRLEGISIDYGPSGPHKSTGMMEFMNKVLEFVVRKLNRKT